MLAWVVRAHCSYDVYRVMFNLHVLGFVAPRRVNLNLHQIIYLNIKSVGCSSLHSVTSTINVQFASNINYYVHDGNLHVCINLCKIRSMPLLDMLYGLCQLLGIDSPSWRTLTSTINVQFAKYKNNCFQVCDFVCAHKLMWYTASNKFMLWLDMLSGLWHLWVYK